MGYSGFEKDVRCIVDYCEKNLWEWKDRLHLMLSKIDAYRIPPSEADAVLYDEIQEAIVDCTEEYELYHDVCVEDVVWFY